MNILKSNSTLFVIYIHIDDDIRLDGRPFSFKRWRYEINVLFMLLSALCLFLGAYWFLLSVSLVTVRTHGATRLTHPRRSLSRDPWKVYTVLSYITMMVVRMVFCMIITQVFCTKFPKHFEMFLFDAVLDPIKAYVHCFGPFLLHCWINFSLCGGIVDLHRGGRLCVSHFL